MSIAAEGLKAKAPRPDSLVQKAYSRIKNSLLAGELKPGEMIAASDLAKPLKMSPTPVHGALKLLANERLVEVIPRVGYVVTGVTVEDIREIFEVRISLETKALDLAMTRVDPGVLKTFSRVSNEDRRPMEKLAGDAEGFLEEAMDRNRAFHLGIAGLSANKRLVAIIGQMLDESRRLYTLDPDARTLMRHLANPGKKPNSKMSDEHEQIAEAIRAADRNRAVAAMESHIRGAQERIIKSLAGGA